MMYNKKPEPKNKLVTMVVTLCVLILIGILSFTFLSCESSINFIKGSNHTLSETFEEDNEVDVDPAAVEGAIKDALMPIPDINIPSVNLPSVKVDSLANGVLKDSI